MPGMPDPVDAILPLHEERSLVSKWVRKTLVRATAATTHRPVAVVPVPIDRVVQAVPPIREENGVTIMPVIEVELLRRLILEEEGRLDRIRSTHRHAETVTLQWQEATGTEDSGPGLIVAVSTATEHSPIQR